MKKKIIISKSFSKVDNNYIQLFKHRRKLAAVIGDFKINDLIQTKNDKNKFNEGDKNTDSTSAKLDSIITKLQQNNSYITRQFLEDISLQNENDGLRRRMQALFKRRKLKEKKVVTEKIKKQEHIGTIQEAIQHMIYLAKKYAVDKETVRIISEQNNKKPPICRYTPSLNYISKHIPSFYFGNQKTIINEKEKMNNFENINFKTKINNKNEENKISSNNSMIIFHNENNYNSISNSKLMITESENSKNNTSLSKSYFNSKSINIKNYSSSNKKNRIKMIKNILRNPYKLQLNKKNKGTKTQPLLETLKSNNNINEGKYTVNAQRNTLIKKYIPRNMKLNHNKMRYNISVPIFNKMTSREKIYPLVDKNKNMADYDPNYDAILPSNYKFNSFNEKMKKKKFKLRKILGSFHPNGEYILLPILNKQ